MSRKNARAEVPVVSRIEPQINRYYLKISRKYTAAGIAMMLSLIIYIILVMMFFGKYVTYENLKYLIRDMGAVSFPINGEYTTIVYNGGDNMKAESFRGGLAICSGDKYLYYDASGVLLTEHEIGYSSPDMASSDKYMLVYDVGGLGYSLYNQLTCIIERESDQRIVAGDIADDGSMLLVTRSRETKYVVELYNSAFNKAMSIYKENFVLDAAISPDGNFAVIVSGIPEDTDLGCEISICKKGSDTALFTASYTHTMPLDVHTDDDGFTLLCDNGVYFFNYSGEILSSFSFGGMNLRYADVNSECTAIVGSVNALGSKNRCVAFDKDGALLYDTVLEERITGAYAAQNLEDTLMYLKTTDKVIRIKPGGKTEELSSDSDIISVVPLEKGALICSKTSAVSAFKEQ